MKTQDYIFLIIATFGIMLYGAMIATKIPTQVNTILLDFILGGLVAIFIVLLKIATLLKDQNKKR